MLLEVAGCWLFIVVLRCVILTLLFWFGFGGGFRICRVACVFNFVLRVRCGGWFVCVFIDCVVAWLLIVLVLYIDVTVETSLFVYCYFDAVLVD